MRIGCIGGQARRVNERVIDDQWTRYLGEHADVVKIPPLAFLKLFGGSIQKWEKRLPDSLPELAEGLRKLCASHDIDTIYVNMPMLIPYLLMARNHGGLDIGLLFIAHSVGSEHWMRQWIGIAPFVTERDVLLASTESSYQALLNISPRYELATRLPLCIELPERFSGTQEQAEHRPQILAIGRLEDVKNVEVLLDCFAAIRERVPDAHLLIAGEYTGQQDEQIAAYRKVIGERIERYELHDAIELPGAVVGEEKETAFRQADLLINLSTDPGETFGFNLIEAKIAGLPVVCTNWDGFADVVEHGVDGLLVDCDWSGDAPVIAQEMVVAACVRLLTDPA
ncbi:MAG: glycosyltransferase family 4 protein, partial [Tumebacillaceae bacterium]